MTFSPRHSELKTATSKASVDSASVKPFAVEFTRRLQQMLGIDRDEALKLLGRAAAITAVKRRLLRKTVRKYRRQYRRMRDANQTPATDVSCSRTYYFRRASWNYGVWRDLRRAIVRMLKSIRDWDIEATKSSMVQVEGLINDAERFPADPNLQRKQDALAGRHVGEFKQLAGDVQRSARKSKRVGAGKTPLSWRQEILVAAERANSPNLLGIAVLDATGCRPVEVATGAQVFLRPDGSIAVILAGSKSQRGVTRVLHCSTEIEDVGARRLAEAARKAGGHLLVSVKSAGALAGSVRWFGRRACSSGSYVISPYSFRHLLASDLKSQRVPPEQIAAIQGHDSDRSCQAYGDFRTGHSRRRISASVSAKVKQVRRDPRKLRARRSISAR